MFELIITTGASDRVVAERLGMDVQTVQNHLQEVRSALAPYLPIETEVRFSRWLVAAYYYSAAKRLEKKRSA